jgi:hypothetical protein
VLVPAACSPRWQTCSRTRTALRVSVCDDPYVVIIQLSRHNHVIFARSILPSQLPFATDSLLSSHSVRYQNVPLYMCKKTFYTSVAIAQKNKSCRLDRQKCV